MKQRRGRWCPWCDGKRRCLPGERYCRVCIWRKPLKSEDPPPKEKRVKIIIVGGDDG